MRRTAAPARQNSKTDFQTSPVRIGLPRAADPQLHDTKHKKRRRLVALFACTSLSTTLLLTPGSAIAQAVDVSAAPGNDDVISLDQVVVTAAGFEQTVKDAPA